MSIYWRQWSERKHDIDYTFPSLFLCSRISFPGQLQRSTPNWMTYNNVSFSVTVLRDRSLKSRCQCDYLSASRPATGNFWQDLVSLGLSPNHSRFSLCFCIAFFPLYVCPCVSKCPSPYKDTSHWV